MSKMKDLAIRIEQAKADLAEKERIIGIVEQLFHEAFAIDIDPEYDISDSTFSLLIGSGCFTPLLLMRASFNYGYAMGTAASKKK